MTQPRCSDVSAAAGEPLAGTAVTVENWLLLEARGTWPRDVASALADGEPGSGPLRSWLDDTPSSRLLFVRRPRGARAEGRVVFVVHASEGAASVRRIRLESLEELDSVDLAHDGEPFAEPLVLVCGHGTRDACCALRGNAVHAALAGTIPREALWLSSHQGGHRFAANVLVLPFGIQLGRVGPDEAAAVVGDACAGRISVPHYRGRTTYSPRVQAAEAFVRRHADLSQVASLALLHEDGGRVTLRADDGRLFTCAVEEVAGPTVPASCGAAAEPQTAYLARLV